MSFDQQLHIGMARFDENKNTSTAVRRNIRSSCYEQVYSNHTQYPNTQTSHT